MSRRGKRWLIVLGAVALLVLAIRLVLDPVATHFANKALARAPGWKGTVHRVHVTVLPPGAVVHDFKMIEVPGGRWDEPLLYAERTRATLDWRELLRGRLATSVKIEDPKVVVARRHEQKAKKTKSLAETLQDMVPARIDRLEIVDGELLVSQGRGKNAPQVWVHDLDLLLDNLATRKHLAEHRPTVLEATAKVQRSGLVRINAKGDPLAKKLTFSGRAALEGLDARELHSVLASKTGLTPTSGTINVFSEFDVKNGRISGGVKPVLEEIEVAAAGDGIGDKLKALVADAGIELASSDDGPRERLATVVPLKGTIEGPDPQLVPAILGVIRNAFVVGITSGFANLPPETAGKPQGIFEQAKEALTPDAGPPKAQPSKGDGKGDRTPDREVRGRAGGGGARERKRP